MPGTEDIRKAAAGLRAAAARLDAVPAEVIGRSLQSTYGFARRGYAAAVQLTNPADAAIRVRRGRVVRGRTGPLGRLWLGYAPIVARHVDAEVSTVLNSTTGRDQVAVRGQVVPRSFVLNLEGRRLHLERYGPRGQSRVRRVTVDVEQPVRALGVRTRTHAMQVLSAEGVAQTADALRLREARDR